MIGRGYMAEKVEEEWRKVGRLEGRLEMAYCIGEIERPAALVGYKCDDEICNELVEAMHGFYKDEIAAILERCTAEGDMMDWLCCVDDRASKRCFTASRIGRLKGRYEGRSAFVIDKLRRLGEPSITLRYLIMKQNNASVIHSWAELAVKADSLEYFLFKTNLVHDVGVMEARIDVTSEFIIEKLEEEWVLPAFIKEVILRQKDYLRLKDLFRRVTEKDLDEFLYRTGLDWIVDNNLSYDQESIIKLLERIDEVPEDLKQLVRRQKDEKAIKEWFMIADAAESLEQFKWSLIMAGYIE